MDIFGCHMHCNFSRLQHGHVVMGIRKASELILTNAGLVVQQGKDNALASLEGSYFEHFYEEQNNDLCNADNKGIELVLEDPY